MPIMFKDPRMHLISPWAAYWPEFLFAVTFILGVIGVVKLDRPGWKFATAWGLAAAVAFGSFIMIFVWILQGGNIQAADLRQQARTTYGVQLTDGQSHRLISGGDDTITLSSEGTSATVQKVHLIQEQDTNRWLLQTRGPKHVIKVPDRQELPKLG
jgi:hypothetical protein